MKIYIKYRFSLNFNNLNNSNDIILVLEYFQLIKILIPYNFITLWNFSLQFSTFFTIEQYGVISSDYNACRKTVQ